MHVCLAGLFEKGGTGEFLFGAPRTRNDTALRIIDDASLFILKRQTTRIKIGIWDHRREGNCNRDADRLRKEMGPFTFSDCEAEE